MPERINRAIELIEKDQPVYYTGLHTRHILTYELGKKDARKQYKILQSRFTAPSHVQPSKPLSFPSRTLTFTKKVGSFKIGIPGLIIIVR